MKKIKIYSHQIISNLKKRTLQNGDTYDSEIHIENGKTIIWKGICNVDSSNERDNDPNKEGLQKVEINEGNYYGIVGKHKNKYKAILILNQIPKMQNWVMVTEKEQIIPTVEINKNWNKKIAKFIRIHKGGDNWDWSEGCITIHYLDYEGFIKHFEMNELIEIEKI